MANTIEAVRVSGSALVLRADALRLPLPNESVDLMFADEKAFRLHITRAGHVDPASVGLVERVRATGPVWTVA